MVNKKKKKILITGFSGFVSSHFADFLLENTDWDIYGFIRWNDNLENIEHLFPRINNKDRVHLLYGDLNDYASLQRIFREHHFDYVSHLGAQSYPQTSFIAPLETLQTNIIGTANLLEAVKQEYHPDIDNKCPVIHICASSEVFGRVPKEYLPINENAPFHPASPYAISKVGTDLVARYYAEAYGFNIMTTRMFTHTGPRRGDVFAESSFAKQIAMIEKELIEPTIKVGNLESLRTWADVRDAVRAYYMLLLNPRSAEPYNIGGNHTCTVREMLDFLISQSTVGNIKVEIEPERLRPIDADLQVPDTTKFRELTGWKPEISFEKTMIDLLNYWRERVSKKNSFLVR